MKKITTLSISALASAMLLMTGCSTNNGSQETAAQSVSITEQSSASEKVGYSLGFMMAEGNKEAVKDLNLDTFEKGFRDGYEGNDSALTQEQMQEVLMTYQKEQEEQFAKDMQTTPEAVKEKAASLHEFNPMLGHGDNLYIHVLGHLFFQLKNTLQTSQPGSRIHVHMGP